MRMIAAGAFALFLASPALAQTEVEFWHAFSGTNGAAVDELATAFNASQDTYEIKPVYTGDYEEGTQKLTAAIAGRTAPGLVMLEVTRYGLFAARGALDPLQPYIDKAGAAWADQIRPFALEASKYLGESYVVPFNVSTPVMYFNKDMFRAAGLDPDAPPATWAELADAAKSLTLRDGDTVTQWGLNPPPQWVRWAMTNQAGGGWIDPEDNAVQIDSPESVRAYQTAADWVNVEHVSSLDAALDEDVSDQYFMSGRSAIDMTSTGDLASRLEEASFDLGVAPLPCDAVCAAPIGGATLGIVATAPQEVKDGAWAFIEFVTTPREQRADLHKDRLSADHQGRARHRYRAQDHRGASAISDRECAARRSPSPAPGRRRCRRSAPRSRRSGSPSCSSSRPRPRRCRLSPRRCAA